ncbi:hypothetical protein FQZ97_700210 [compost metagenome]
MHGADSIWIEILIVDQLERCIKLLGEIVAAAAIIGERCNCRKRVLLAEIGTKAGFHAPDSEQRTGWNAITLFDCSKERRILLLHRTSALDDRVCAALLHELLEGKLEALLIAVSIDRGLRIFGVGQSTDCTLANATSLRFLDRLLEPGIIASAVVSALGCLSEAGSGHHAHCKNCCCGPRPALGKQCHSFLLWS